MKQISSRQFNWDVCGHDKIVHFLQSAILSGNLTQAYLFSGPSGLGKKFVASKLIASILCQNLEKPVPCGVCSSCQQVANGLHPDFYTVNQEINEKTGKLSRGIIIDQIRNLKYKLQQGTLLNGYKVALISDAHLMNLNTSNALLKILEEPTSNTVIILLADDVSYLPQTISSRCQIVRFLPVATSDIKSYLENRGVFDSGLIARQANGRPGVAIDLSNNKELADGVKNNIDGFFKIIEADLNSRFEIADKIISWDKDEYINISSLNNLMHNWQLALRDVMLIKSDNEQLVSNINYLDKLKEQAEILDFLKIKTILRKINQVDDYAKHNINSKSILENLIINL
ncbi:MAG: DNA polymerase III subunit delta' [Candidatus Buchananbacteria bacterium]|nr:DNA polymerase III subunit delta' [Candidatus Buchananbacteria bacterium]